MAPSRDSARAALPPVAPGQRVGRVRSARLRGEQAEAPRPLCAGRRGSGVTSPLVAAAGAAVVRQARTDGLAPPPFKSVHTVVQLMRDVAADAKAAAGVQGGFFKEH